MDDQAMRQERLDHLGYTVQWPDLCCRCGHEPAKQKRRFQVPAFEFDPELGHITPGSEFDQVWISPPLCDDCYAESGGILGHVRRLFAWWHKVAFVEEGRLVFANGAFNQEFRRLNSNLRSDGGFGERAV